MEIANGSERLVVYNTAVDALSYLRTTGERKPAVIILDLNLPKMNGMEFLKKVNEKYGEAMIPVLITSNMSSMQQISEGVSLGIRGYIIKSNESLQSIVDAVDTIFKK